jgi:Transglycosylase SLT domain
MSEKRQGRLSAQECCLTLHSRGGPTACHQARATGRVRSFSVARAWRPTVGLPLSSNVRLHIHLLHHSAVKTTLLLSLIAFVSNAGAQTYPEPALPISPVLVPYTPTTPSKVPESAGSWVRAATKLIDVVGASASSRSSATDVYYEAVRAGLDPNLILATVELMSRFDERARSSQGAVGLMQITAEIQSRIGSPENTLLQGKYNLRLGCSYLRLLLDREAGDIERALRAYLTDASQHPNADTRATEILVLAGARLRSLPQPK